MHVVIIFVYAIYGHTHMGVNPNRAGLTVEPVYIVIAVKEKFSSTWQVVCMEANVQVPAILRGLRAYFSGHISHAHVQDLISSHSSDDQAALSVFIKQHRGNNTPGSLFSKGVLVLGMFWVIYSTNPNNVYIQEITNRTHVSRTPKPEHLIIALVSYFSRGPFCAKVLWDHDGSQTVTCGHEHIRFDMTKSTHKFIGVQILCSTCVYEYVCMCTYIIIYE